MSFRWRLAIWTMAVIAVVLIGFSAAFISASEARLRGGIDFELRGRAFGAARGPGPNAFGGPPDGPPNGPPNGPANVNQLPRGGDLRRPRWFGEDGKALVEGDGPFDAAALRRQASGFSEVVYQGDPVRVFTLVSHPEGPGFAGTIQVARDLRDVRDMWAAQWRSLAWMLPIALGLAALGAMFLSSRAMKPIASLRAAAESITERELDHRLPVEGNDEFARLTETFNGMIGRLQTAFEQLGLSLEQQRRFTADASHELRTPLTRIRLAASSHADPQKSLETIEKAASTMARMVDDLLLLAKADAGKLVPQLERLDLRIPVAEAVDMLDKAKITFKAPEDAVWIRGDADHVRRAVTNLLSNAQRFARSKPVEVFLEPEGRVIVKDDGPGIAPEALRKLGDRFYRVDDARDADSGGTGLGLSIVRAIMDAHGGSVSIDSTLGAGTTATLSFEKTQLQTSSS